MRQAIAAAAAESLAPDGNATRSSRRSRHRFKLELEQIVLGNGSNDILELATQAFLRPGDQAVYSQHAFAVYPLATQARGAAGIEVPARELGHDLPAMRAALTPRTRIVFVANPNNPTGSWLAPEAVCEFIASVPPDVLVVLDEAYNEYLDPSQQADSAAWLARHPNLLISRTFSKAYGLAGLRVGYGLADAAVADMLNRVRQPFNVNSVAQAAAIAALADTAYVEESARLNRSGLTQLMQGSTRSVSAAWFHTETSCWCVGAAAMVYKRCCSGRDRAGGGQLRFAGAPAGLGRPARRKPALPCGAASRTRALTACTGCRSTNWSSSASG